MTPTPPFCVRLRSKRILTRGVPPLTEADVLDASRWCWCVATDQILGPDRHVAHPADCRKGRSCFESPFHPTDTPLTSGGR